MCAISKPQVWVIAENRSWFWGKTLPVCVLAFAVSPAWADVASLKEEAAHAEKDYKACLEKVTSSAICDEVCEKWATDEQHVKNAMFVLLAQNIKKCRHPDRRTEDACLYANMEYDYGIKVDRSNPESTWKENKEAVSKFLRKEYAGSGSHAEAVCKAEQKASATAARSLSNAVATQKMEAQEAKDEANRRWTEQQIQQQKDAERRRVEDLENDRNEKIRLGQQLYKEQEALDRAQQAQQQTRQSTQSSPLPFGLEGMVKNEGPQILKNVIFGN